MLDRVGYYLNKLQRKGLLYGSAFGTMGELQTSNPYSTFTTDPKSGNASLLRKHPTRSPGASTGTVAAAKATTGRPKGLLWRKENNRLTVDALVFRQGVYAAMIRHCLEKRPLEACGLLSGKAREARTLWPMTNVLHSRHAFEMDLRQIEDVLRRIGEKGEQLVGIYHSHPTAPPYPSQSDVDHANYPEAATVIVSLSGAKPEVRCFRILHRKVIPVRHEIIR